MTRLLFTLVALLLVVSACTLDSAQDVRESSLNATQTALPQPTNGLATGIIVVQPTQATVEFPPTPVLQSNDPGVCGRLRVNVGTDPGNTLRLREQPNNSSTILLLIPNNSLVTRVAGAQDVNAGGYTWVNIQYTDPNGDVVSGWAAKNAMQTHDTLLPEGC